MVRHVFTFTFLLFSLVPTLFALPAPRQKNGCVAPYVRSLGAGGIPMCSLPPGTPAPTAQTLERRAGRKARNEARVAAGKSKLPNSRKAGSKARVAAGKPKATKAERGRTGAPRVKPKVAPMTQKKAEKVAERKENRKLGKLQKHGAKVAEAFNKQKLPLHVVDRTGKLRKPEAADVATKDVAKKAWADKQKAQTAKDARRAAFHALSPTDKLAREKASGKKQEAARQGHINANTKQTNRQQRIVTKAAANASRKAANRNAAGTARTAYSSAQRMPPRGAQYTSPQGKLYNGKDVRQAVYASELATAKGKVGYNKFTGKASKNSDKLPKNFENRKNSDGTIPLHGALPTAANPLREFPILHNKQMGHDGRKPAPTEARIITQKNAAGQTELKGLVGHPAGSQDHKSF